MQLELQTIVHDFAEGMQLADGRRPQAVNSRSKGVFQPGIGPHAEAQTIALVMAELRGMLPERYGSFSIGVPYPSKPRLKCDLCLGKEPDWTWAIEVKMIRFLGDNGKLNDNILMHILSPYPAHRSAVTDCDKLIKFGLNGRKAVLMYGFDHKQWPLQPAIEAFEVLANTNEASPQTDKLYRGNGSLENQWKASGCRNK